MAELAIDVSIQTLPQEEHIHSIVRLQRLIAGHMPVGIDAT